ncbi:MAG: ABC transporter permease [Chloroflexi bacterium]|nr:ABC transporter permease [Chloroflexota bacterium]
MNIRTRKVLRDIWFNKARTGLVIASIAIGLMAISATFRAQAIFSQNLEDGLAAINPTSATLLTAGADDEMITAVSKLPTIADVEGRQTIWSRIKIGDEWLALKLVAIPDFTDAQIDKIRPVNGHWPPADKTLLIERSSMGAAGVDLNDIVIIEAPSGVQQEIEIVGTVHDLTVMSGELLNQVIFGYTTLETAVWLGLSDNFTEIKLTVADDPLNVTHIQQVADDASDEVEEGGLPVFGIQIPTPGKHLMDSVVQSLLLILGSLGGLSLLLSAFLVFNTVSAILSRQVPQIGVMKAIGAPRRDILMMYLTTIFIFSGVALLIAVPLGMVGARVMTVQLAKLMNFDVNSFQVPSTILLLELSIGVLVPLLAAMAPILRGTQLTVREAFSSQSGSGQFGTGLIDRWLSKMRGLSISVSYAARNIFRRKGRLILTLLTLSIGGAIFITTLSVRASLFVTIDSIAAYWQQDVTVELQRPYRFAELERIVTGISNVTAVEGWHATSTFRVRDDGTESTEDITLFAIPQDSQFVEPTLLNGRWFSPDDKKEIVLNIDLAADAPDIALNDEITMRINGRESEWQVVGTVTTQMVGVGEPRPEIPIAYVAYDDFETAVGGHGMVNRVVVGTMAHTAVAQSTLSDQLDARLKANDIRIRTIDTHTKMRTQAENLTMPILLLLLSMAVLFAFVGGLSLAGTMSLNVLERTQEIGIIRAIGAPGRDIMQIVIIEGVFVGLLSWLLAALLAYPMGWMMSAAVGISFIKVPLIYAFAPLGILLWLALVILLAIIASYVPARNASKLIVREALAYE